MSPQQQQCLPCTLPCQGFAGQGGMWVRKLGRQRKGDSWTLSTDLNEQHTITNHSLVAHHTMAVARTAARAAGVARKCPFLHSITQTGGATSQLAGQVPELAVQCPHMVRTHESPYLHLADMAVSNRGVEDSTMCSACGVQGTCAPKRAPGHFFPHQPCFPPPQCPLAHSVVVRRRLHCPLGVLPPQLHL